MPEHEHGRGTGRRQGHIRIVVRTRDPPIRTRVNVRAARPHSTHASRGFAKDYPPPFVVLGFRCEIVKRDIQRVGFMSEFGSQFLSEKSNPNDIFLETLERIMIIFSKIVATMQL